MFANSKKNPKVLVSVGMAFLVLALVWPRYIHLSGHLSKANIDGVRGFFFGISIGMGLWAVKLSKKARSCARADGAKIS